MLSLGCTDERLVVPRKMGLLSGVRLSVDMMFQGQSFAADSTARILLGGGGAQRDPVMRVDITVDRGFAKLDSVERIKDLEEFGRAEARQALPRMRKEFLTAPRPAFTPCHGAEVRQG